MGTSLGDGGESTFRSDGTKSKGALALLIGGIFFDEPASASSENVFDFQSVCSNFPAEGLSRVPSGCNGGARI